MAKITKKFIDLAGLHYYHQKSKESDLRTFVLKEVGKGLSSNDFTNAEKEKLANLRNMDISGTGLTQEQVEKLNNAASTDELSVINEKIANLQQANYQNEEQVRSIVENAKHLVRKIVTSEDDIDTTETDADKTIFLVPLITESIGTLYTEWMVIDGQKVMVGDGDTRLESYIKKTDLEDITDSDISAIFTI